jgi:adenylyl-sulfate kinase
MVAVNHAIFPGASTISPAERAAFYRHQPATVWLTGLSGSGKSTLAYALEKRLMDLGHACCVLDGDNVRHRLNRDLGFAPSEREENIRRVAEVAALFNDAGLIVITSFISPYLEHREMARGIIGGQRFVEIYLDAPIEVCERRDVKGLYAKARAGRITEFTGVSAPYEPPSAPAMRINSDLLTLGASVDMVLTSLKSRLAGA